MYVIDTQLNVFLKRKYVANRKQYVQRLEAYLEDIRIWMHTNFLKAIKCCFFAPERSSPNIIDISITINCMSVRSSESVRNLGVVFDRTMSMDLQDAGSCFMHLRKIVVRDVAYRKAH